MNLRARPNKSKAIAHGFFGFGMSVSFRLLSDKKSARKETTRRIRGAFPRAAVSEYAGCGSKIRTTAKPATVKNARANELDLFYHSRARKNSPTSRGVFVFDRRLFVCAAPPYGREINSTQSRIRG